MVQWRLLINDVDDDARDVVARAVVQRELTQPVGALLHVLLLRHEAEELLVRHGPAWDRADTAIPAEMVAGFGEGGIRLGITRRQVRDLPPADIDRA